jgi:hypothetical protein
MNHFTRGFLTFTAAALATVSLLPVASRAQNAPKDNASSASAKSDQWIHIRVESKDDKGETVRVNVPVEMAVKILPCINKENLHGGKVHIDDAHFHDDVDVRALLDAVRTSKDGEFVTVESREDNVRVAKSNGFLLIHVTEYPHSKHAADDKDGKSSKANDEERVEVKVPMKVVDALFSGSKDELDIVAALHALSSFGDTELVSVKEKDQTVRIWIDSKNVTD